MREPDGVGTEASLIGEGVVSAANVNMVVRRGGAVGVLMSRTEASMRLWFAVEVSATFHPGRTPGLTVVMQRPLDFIQMRIRHNLMRHQHRLWKRNHLFPRDRKRLFLLIHRDRQQPHTARGIHQDDAERVRRVCARGEEGLD